MLGRMNAPARKRARLPVGFAESDGTPRHAQVTLRVQSAATQPNPEFSPVSRGFGQLDQKRELFSELRLHVSDTLATTVCCSSSDLSSQLDFGRHSMVGGGVVGACPHSSSCCSARAAQLIGSNGDAKRQRGL